MLYGRGAFTTLAVHRHQPFLWSEHWARLMAHAARVGVETAEFEEAPVRKLLSKLIEANQVKEGRARLTLLTDVERGVWKVEHPLRRKSHLVVITGDPHI